MIKEIHQTRGLSILCLMRKDMKACAQLHEGSFPRSWSQGYFESLYDQESVIGLAAKHQDAMAGFILGMVCGERLEILTIAVDPAVRRQGVAQSLFYALSCLCLEGGLDVIQLKSYPSDGYSFKANSAHKKALSEVVCLDLEVSVENIPAINLYEKIGFVREGTRKNYFQEKGDRRIDAALYRFVIDHQTSI